MTFRSDLPNVISSCEKKRNKYLDAETDNFIGLSFQEVVLASEKFLKGNTMIQGLSNNHFKALGLVYDRNPWFGLGPIPKPKPELADTGCLNTKPDVLNTY